VQSFDLYRACMMEDNPSEIAEYLIRENGIEHALQVTHDGTTKAQQDGDNYALSVWREVKIILHEGAKPFEVH
jgi:hypothetical protein